uniref:glucuronosyltransferase n=1 Tax=Ditylenchus dipsaci TaxID=166011 RepID=A0A915DF21_9BILA
MPDHMANCFAKAFSRFPGYEFVWKTEITVMEAEKYTNIHLLRWIPQKELMANQKTKLLIAHGGYNSFLEAAQAVVEVLDKLALSDDKIAEAINKTLHDPKYSKNAVKLASMLQDKPSQEPHAVLKYSLKLAKMPRNYFALKAAQKLSQFQFYNYDIIGYFLFFIVLISLR